MSTSVQPRRCPRCRETPIDLRHADKGSVVLDLCPCCDGVWVDGEEWRPLFGVVRAVRQPDGIAYGMVPLACPACPPRPDRHGRLTPRPLRPRGLDGVADLEIDVCERCGGAWLDGGEMARVREAMARLRPPEHAPPRSAASPPETRRPARAAFADSEAEAMTFLEALADTWRTLIGR